MVSEYRQLPSVDKLLSDERVKQLETRFPHNLLVELARQQLEQERRAIAAGKKPHSTDEIVNLLAEQASAIEAPSLRPVINATGVVLHTNLGRAPLSDDTIAAMSAASRGYNNLEFDLESGTRGSRHVHIEPILCRLTGAEAALVVNNNASAVLLCLTVLAKRKEVIVSRGQAVEIGGGFRIPDVMRQSGAKLVEVGTTNCTYVYDFEQAITPQTAALMRVHSSNFKVVGFTSDVVIEELNAMGKEKNIPVLDDLGSGCFIDTAQFSLAPEPTVQQSVTAGSALVCFSGDKLVGGPQAGIIVGRKDYIDKLKKHPLVRAMRIDKTRLAGLQATLLHYLKGEAAVKIPVWRMIALPLTDIDRRARQWADILGMADVIEGESMIGGGSLPGATLPTRLVAVKGSGKKKAGDLAQALAQKLRALPVPIIGRISGDTLLLDPRTVFPEEDEVVMRELREIKG